MGWLLFEAMLALAAMVAVVWWTLHGRAEPDDDLDDPVDRSQ